MIVNHQFAGSHILGRHQLGAGFISVQAETDGRHILEFLPVGKGVAVEGDFHSVAVSHHQHFGAFQGAAYTVESFQNDGCRRGIVGAGGREGDQLHIVQAPANGGNVYLAALFAHLAGVDALGGGHIGVGFGAAHHGIDPNEIVTGVFIIGNEGQLAAFRIEGKVRRRFQLVRRRRGAQAQAQSDKQ